MSTEITDTQPQQLTANDVKAQVQLIQQVMKAVMQEGFHYGVIPGQDRPTLLKPGAEKLVVTFRLAPELDVQMHDLGDGHREYQVKCRLVHIPTGRIYGEGVGSCSTQESRYRYRQAARTCPYCGRSTIIKGKAEYGGGWLCFQRKGGCGAKFADQDSSIVSQGAGREENTDLADTYNTVLKMAKKRALVDATLTATAASDCFTQDLEDFQPEEAPGAAPRPPVETAPGVTTLGPTTATRPLTRGQVEILPLAAPVPSRRGGVSAIPERDVSGERPQHLLQKDLNTVLEWLELQQETRIQPAEDEVQKEGKGVISQAQIGFLMQAAKDCGVTEGALKIHLIRPTAVNPAKISLPTNSTPSLPGSQTQKKESNS